jgi:ABC-2 type transport system permease protein
MKRFALLTKALVLSTLREPQTLFWNLLFPVFWLVIYKMVFGRFLDGQPNGGGWILAGLIVLNLLSFGLIGSSAQMVEMRDKGVLRRLKATPLPAWQMFVAYLVNNVLVCLAQIAVLIAAGVMIAGARLTLAGLLQALPMILAGIVAFTALGQVISSLAPKMGLALAIGQIAYFGQMFVTDLIMPLEAMPESVRKVAVYLPGYLVGDLVRAPLLGNGWSSATGGDLLLLLAYTLAAGLVAARFFRWEPRA